MTFEEAYKKTGRILCITLSATTKKAPPVLINYISAPNVTINSAVVASAAVPGFIKPVILQIKNSDGVVRNQSQNYSYCDGSIDQVCDYLISFAFHYVIPSTDTRAGYTHIWFSRNV